MTRPGAGPDFIEALARGFDVIRAFHPQRPVMTLSELATATDLARPTVRRILLTLEEIGYTRSTRHGFTLTPRVLELGASFTRSTGLWDVANPHMERLSDVTGESSAIAQLDGCDIIFVARVIVPKFVSFSVNVGTRIPAFPSSLGKVLLAELSDDALHQALSQPTLSGLTPPWQPDPVAFKVELENVRTQGWAISDEQAAPGIISVAAPVRNADGLVVASLNINANANTTTRERMIEFHLPHVIETAKDISTDFAHLGSLPQVTLHQ